MAKTLFKIGNFVAFYLIWFAALFGARLDIIWLGPMTAIAYGIFHFLAQKEYKTELKFAIFVTILGTCIDTMNMHFHVFTITVVNHIAPIVPLWLIAIWASFGLTLKNSMSWLHGRYWLAAACGSIAAPLSYFAGERVNVMAFPNFYGSMLTLAILWMLLTPALIWLATITTGTPRHSRVR